MYEIKKGDCLEVMGAMEADSVDLIFTSPPYAMMRRKTYGGVEADEYVGWFMPIAEQMMRVLKPQGSFILNIKEHVEEGERHPYVLELILEMRKAGWRWTEQYIWLKNASPITPFARLKDGWERLIHFTLAKDFKWRPERLKQPLKDPDAPKKLDPDDMEMKRSTTGSGHFVRPGRLAKLTDAFPSNVIKCSGVDRRFKHSAMFPVKLPEFFITAMTDIGDLVLDPFCGSGTTLEAARNLNRISVGIDNNEHSLAVAEQRMGGVLL